MPEAAATLTRGGVRRRDASRRCASPTRRARRIGGDPSAARCARPGRDGRPGRRARAAARSRPPGLEAWLAGMLGEPGRLRFAMRFGDPTGRRRGPAVQATLADVGLAAIDVVFLAPAGEADGPRAPRPCLRPGARPAAAGPPRRRGCRRGRGLGRRSLADLAVVGRTLRRLVAEARDLDGRDLGDTGRHRGPGRPRRRRRARGPRRRRCGRRWTRAAPRWRPPCRPPTASAPRRRPGRDAGLAGFALARRAAPRRRRRLVAQGAALLAADRARLAAFDARVATEDAGWAALDDDGPDRGVDRPAAPAHRARAARRTAFRAGRGCRAGRDLRPPAPRRPRGRHRLAVRRGPRRFGSAAAARRHRPDRGGARRRCSSTSASGSCPTSKARAGPRCAARPRTSAAGCACWRPALARPPSPAAVSGLVLAPGPRRFPGAARRQPGRALRRAVGARAAGDPAVRSHPEGRLQLRGRPRRGQADLRPGAQPDGGPRDARRLGQFLPAAYLHDDTTPVDA